MSIENRIAKSNRDKHEAVIERWVSSAPEVGMAFKSILDDQLYKIDFDTFEAYLKARWGFSRSRAYQLIEAAEVVLNLSTTVDKKEVPTAERQLREVGKAPPEQQAEVVRKAAEKAAEENRKPTAADYKKVVGELLLEGESAPAPNAPPVPRPPEHHPKEMAGPLMAHVSTLTKMLNDLKKRKDERGGEWIDVQAISTQVSALKYSLKSSIYCADCPACHGERCEKCKQTGFLPELKSATVDGTK